MTGGLTSSSFSEELHSILSALVGGAQYGIKVRLPHALLMTFLFRRDLTAEEKLRTILKLVTEHATNLAVFAAIYKTMLVKLKFLSRMLRNTPVDSQVSVWKTFGRCLLEMIVDGPLAMHPRYRIMLDTFHLAPPGHPEHTYHSFLAGAVGGYFVWGRYSSVNQQIVLYLASRVMVGLWKRLLHGGDVSRQGDLSASSSAINRDIGIQSKSSKSFPIVAAVVWGLVMALFEESPHVLQSSLKSSMDEIYRRDLRRQGRKHPVTRIV